LTVSDLTAQERVAAIVRGDASVPPVDEGERPAFIGAAASHGLKTLVAERLASPAFAHWPETLRAALHRELALAVAIDALRQQELSAVLAALARRGVRPLVLKGSALAYTLYSSAVLRPRFDADLLVGRKELDIASSVMRERGYTRPHQVTGEMVMHQLDYARKDAHGVWHVYDFHWKLANRHAVADVLSYEEMARDAIAIDALGPGARGLSRVHALMLACIHRVAHHPSDERLIWVYDIHLLAEGLTPGEAAGFAELAVGRRVSAVCADGLGAARRWFGTRVPGDVLERLGAPPSDLEPSAALLRLNGDHIDELLWDLKSVPEWSKRFRLIYEHAFPPAGYMSGMYMVSSRAWLPALYAHRIARATWRWVRRTPR
jgi:hypothetical protein